jgi:hypothetical protein
LWVQAEAIMAKLTASGVQSKREPGRYGDGDGLWLEVATSQRRAWFLCYMRNGKARTMALGDAQGVSLKRRASRDAETAAQAKRTTFGEAAQHHIAAGHGPGWRNPKHRQQWRNTLTTYAEPVIGKLPGGAVTTERVLEVLNPIWRARPKTASRVRGRVEQVLSYGILAAGVTARTLRSGVVTYSSCCRRRARYGCGASRRARLAHEPSGVRSGEVRGVTCEEFDLSARTWTIPAARMKAARPHRVPLSAPALGILRAMANASQEPRGCRRLASEGCGADKPERLQEVVPQHNWSGYTGGRRWRCRMSEKSIRTGGNPCAGSLWALDPETR